MSKTKEHVCVIIPAFNEATVIKDVVKNAKRIFNNQKEFSIDIVVVNDGSSDETRKKAIEAGVIVIDHILNSGAGGATLTGLLYARKGNYSYAATMDADGQHDPHDTLIGISQASKEGTDLTIGSRLINSTGMSRVKFIGNKGLSFITWILFGINVTDSQSGLRIYSKEAIDKLDWKSNGYEFCSEMIWRAKQAKMSIKEYPIRAIYTDYSQSKGQNNWNAINIVKKLFKQRIVELFE